MSKETSDLAFEYEDIVEPVVDTVVDDDKLKSEEKDKKVVDNEPEYTEAELKALKGGWKPESEWQGNSDDWVSAKEFNIRGELMSRITSQGDLIRSNQGELNDVKTALKALAEHNKKIANIEYEKAKKALHRQKAEALDERDSDAVVEIDDKLEELKESKRAADSTEADSTNSSISEEDAANQIGMHPVVKAWMDSPENAWYKNDVVRGVAADALAGEYISAHPGDVDGMVAYVDENIRKRFPSDFNEEPVRKTPPTTVTEVNGRAAGKVKTKDKTPTYTQADLSTEQLSIAKTFEADGILSVQEYVDQLAEIGDLPSQQG